jgi:UDP-N-acetylmuramoylalanine--D-glutamate ligase
VADKISPDTALALEVSSYQLETAESFRASVGAVLNVTPDHLARHGSMEAYAGAKFRLFQNLPSGGAAVLNAADPWDRRFATTVRGPVHWFGLSAKPGVSLFRSGDHLVSRVPGAAGTWALPRHLPGDHNVENALAAVGLARLAGVPVTAVAKALESFPGVEHRLEFVRELRGVRYVNDSKATNVDSTLVALKAFPGGLHVVMGGEDKGAPYTPLMPLLRQKAKAVYLIGEAAPKIRRDLKGITFVECGTMARAVEAAASRAVPGEIVLLSPACASFDQFDNFEHRGRVFKALAEAL